MVDKRRFEGDKVTVGVSQASVISALASSHSGSLGALQLITYMRIFYIEPCRV
jgi:hypothetical protein